MQCTRSGGCLPTEPLQPVSRLCNDATAEGHTVDIDVVLQHILAELREPLGRVYFGHVDGAEEAGCVKGSMGRKKGL